jgi:MFS transporter, FSR family, fosmidomycin resistance protein
LGSGSGYRNWQEGTSVALDEEVSRQTPSQSVADTENRTMIGLLSLGHIIDDLNVGALPAMLAYFIAELGLSYASAGGLMLALTITSSIVQPLLGQMSDRHPLPWLVPIGVFLAGLGIALSSIMPSYVLILLVVGISGLGVAAFHPEGARLVNKFAGNRKATGMSFFGLGGSLGVALGPVYVTPFLLAFGLGGGFYWRSPHR